MSVISALAQSRKAWVLLIAIVGVVAMNIAGRIDGAAALDFVKWLVATWFAAVALEDASAKSASVTNVVNKTTPPSLE